MTRTPGVDAAAQRSSLVRDALSVAHDAHAGQPRNGNPDMPFIEHPLSVAERLSQQGYPDEVLAAALLHDVVEHSEVEADEVHERFGAEVAGLVADLTEDETVEPYEARKDEHRRHVAAAGPEARAIFAADKLANVEVLREAYAVQGEKVDEGLKVSLDAKLAVWEQDLEMLSDAFGSHPIVDRLAEELAGLRRERAAEARASSG
jgi:(p)ppGpp synthase/HD superfamily hydrolase